MCSVPVWIRKVKSNSLASSQVNCTLETSTYRLQSSDIYDFLTQCKSLQNVQNSSCTMTRIVSRATCPHVGI
jgi:hypothetical protein